MKKKASLLIYSVKCVELNIESKLQVNNINLTIIALSEPVDIYCQWLDESDRINKTKADSDSEEENKK